MEDLAPSFTADGALGCRHYQRACKLRAECCNRLFTCRLCHDEAVTSHGMDRYAVRDVLCMRCGTLQPVGKYCRSKECEGQSSLHTSLPSHCQPEPTYRSGVAVTA